MARVTVPVTTVVRTGVATPTEVNGDATNHHSMANDGQTWIQARNSGASSRDVTISLNRTVDGSAAAAKVVAVAAGVTKLIGPFPPNDYGTTVLFTVAHAEVKLLGFRLP